MKQRTIQRSLEISGIGLHSGKTVILHFSPAEPDTGIVFYRSDIAEATPILANYQLVNDTIMSSNLTNEQQQRIGTVEHLMSAISALGIDNLRIDVSAPEIPIMDGSALLFIEYLLTVGIQFQNKDKKFIQVMQEVKVEQDGKWASLVPYTGFKLDFHIDFNHPAFDQQHNHLTLNFSSESFIKQIAPARTFGFIQDIDYLQSQNLALGGSMDNAIVLDEKQVLNPEGLRFADEFVRHKILDAVGDLYLAGHQILGYFSAHKSGHALNNQLLRKLFSDENNFKIVTNYDKQNPPISYL